MKIQKEKKSSIRGKKQSPNHGHTNKAQGNKPQQGASKLDATKPDTERKK